MKKALSFAFAMLVIIGASAQGQNFDTVKIRPLKLTENIYMLTGSGGNIGVLTGADGVLMIDDQFSPLADKIKDAVSKLDHGPIKYLINTHIHGDHTGSNEFFSEAGASIIAHDQVLKRMQVEQVNKKFGNTPPRDKNAWPVLTFSNQINLHLNGQEIEVHHFDKGHTDGDIVIFFKTANVVHTGDLFARYGYPFIDFGGGGTIDGFINNLDKMMLMMDDNTKVIPGHGNLAKKSDLKIFRDKIKDIRDQIGVALKKGKKPEELTALGITMKYDAEWGKGFLKGNDFVLMVAESMAAKP